MTARRRINRPARDRALAQTFRRNARGFFRSGDETGALYPDHALYDFAIAIELSLKAFLLWRGVSDDWNRRHIRHDLRKALKCARRAGLIGLPEALCPLTQKLSPAYQRHAIVSRSEALLAVINVPEACETVRVLLAAVEAAIGGDGERA
jgi:hypothetical protein